MPSHVDLALNESIAFRAQIRNAVNNDSLEEGDGNNEGSPRATRTSDAVAQLCDNFEEQLLAEVEKARAFLTRSFDAFQQYFEDNRAKWEQDEASKRVKDNMRYLYTEVGHLIQFAETNSLSVKTLLLMYLNSNPNDIGDDINEEMLLPPLDRMSHSANDLKRVIEVFWADQFSGGRIGVAKQSITRRAASASQAFRAGAFAAMIFSLLMYWAHLWWTLDPSEVVVLRFDRIFPVLRLFLALIWAFVTWSGVLYVYNRCSINYLYIFEFSQFGSNLTWMTCLEYSLLMMMLLLFSGALYVRSEMTRPGSAIDYPGSFPEASPFIMPVFIIIFIFSLLVPWRHAFRRARNQFFKVFFSVLKLPFGAVRFADFFVADWGTSLTYALGDLMYTVCYYVATPNEAFTHSTEWDRCYSIRKRYWFLIALLPFIWRGMQCIKMNRQTGNRRHLWNLGKYTCLGLSYLTQFVLGLYSQSTTLKVLNWMMRITAQGVAYAWDITIDWGWIRGWERKRVFKTWKPYVFSWIFDFCGRFFFIPASIYLPGVFSENNCVLIYMFVEVTRRAVWSIFRIENENINNLEAYRSVDFVPKVVLPDEEDD